MPAERKPRQPRAATNLPPDIDAPGVLVIRLVPPVDRHKHAEFCLWMSNRVRARARAQRVAL